MKAVSIEALDFTLRKRPTLKYRRYLQLLHRLRNNRRECLFFCEHPPTITAGTQAQMQNLLVAEDGLLDQGIDFERIKRGGDMTAHEPGQLVIYVHVDLIARGIGLASYFEQLLKISRQAILEIWQQPTTLQLEAPGLYINQAKGPPAKLLSIGVDFRKGFSGHGVALNVTNNLKTFSFIHPCGYADQPMTTIAKLGLDVSARHRFKNRWLEIFQKTLMS